MSRPKQIQCEYNNFSKYNALSKVSCGEKKTTTFSTLRITLWYTRFLAEPALCAVDLMANRFKRHQETGNRRYDPPQIFLTWKLKKIMIIWKQKNVWFLSFFAIYKVPLLLFWGYRGMLIANTFKKGVGGDLVNEKNGTRSYIWTSPDDPLGWFTFL